MRVVFTGSRDWPFYQAVWDDLYDLSMQAWEREDEFHVYVGDARGVDSYVDKWVENNGHAVTSFNYFKADWNMFGKAAGFIRNSGMIAAAVAYGVEDVVFRAYRLNNSRGTTDAIHRLQGAGVHGRIMDLTITEV